MNMYDCFKVRIFGAHKNILLLTSFVRTPTMFKCYAEDWMGEHANDSVVGFMIRSSELLPLKRTIQRWHDRSIGVLEAQFIRARIPFSGDTCWIVWYDSNPAHLDSLRRVISTATEDVGEV